MCHTDWIAHLTSFNLRQRPHTCKLYVAITIDVYRVSFKLFHKSFTRFYYLCIVFLLSGCIANSLCKIGPSNWLTYFHNYRQHTRIYHISLYKFHIHGIPLHRCSTSCSYNTLSNVNNNKQIVRYAIKQ